MIEYANIIGNQETWENFITNVQMQDVPFLDWLPTGGKLVNAIHNYQTEKYRDPALNVHKNGVPVTGFQAAGDSRAELVARAHYSTKAASVTTLHQDVSDNEAVEDELAHELDKQNYELKTDIEGYLLDDSEAVAGVDGVTGTQTRSVGSWLSTSAHSVDDFNSNFRPASASVSTTATGSITEDSILDVLASIRSVTRSREPITAFMGPSLKRWLNNRVFFLPSSASTQASGVNYTKPLGDRSIGRVMQRYEHDGGPVDFVIADFMHAIDGSAIQKNWSAYFLHQSKWELRWNKKPTWMRKAYQGGSYEAFCEAIWMLLCKSPRGEGAYLPAS
jgi:hypothetical protein